uniref:Zinc finger PMZ-type domain-containing protein n=1 Tax=Fagus sylvatica TaxID=28930 RepID=A0A2N9IWN4_FAGSY
MAPTMYIVYLRFNGEIIYGQNGAEYQGSQMKFIRVHRGISFVELETKIFNALQLDNQSHRITVTYRCPQEVLSLLHKVMGDGLEAEDCVGEDVQQMTVDDTAPFTQPSTIGRCTPQLHEIPTSVEDCGPSTRHEYVPYEVNPLPGVHDTMMLEVTADDEEENADYDNDSYFDDDDNDAYFDDDDDETTDVHNDEVDDVVWDAKQKAIANIYGDWGESYQLLPKFMKALIDSNPGTQVEWKTYWSEDAGSAIFESVFWAFGPSIQGFVHCRPVVCIDATHLYGKYEGKLMIAMTTDANNEIYPLAFVVMEKESKDTWRWFLRCLKKHVTKNRELCIISDRHGGILNAMKWSKLQPLNAYHRFCIRHLVSNFNTRFHDKRLKNMIQRAGEHNQLRKFNATMDSIRHYNKDAADILDKETDVEKWTLAKDGGRRYGAMTTNLSECFNGVLKGASNLPITAMVEFIYFKLVHYFNDRRVKTQAQLTSGQAFSTHAMEIFQKWSEKASLHHVIEFNREEGTFQIQTQPSLTSMNKGNHRHVVKLGNRTYSCGKWLAYHIPCSHVIAACASQHINVYQYIDPFYSLTEMLACYQPHFEPMKDAPYWEEDPNFPMLRPDPRLLRQRGRPKSTRIRNEMDWRENQHKQSCGIV